MADTQSSGYSLEGLQVLIVEDSMFMQSVLMNILRSFRIRNLRVASDGIAALSELQRFDPDLIICDLRMEVLDGIEFISMVRTGSESRNPFVPILVLSAHTDQSRVYQARDAGMTEFLAKPISAAKLYDRIRQIIERPRQFVKNATFFGPDRRRSRGDGKAELTRRNDDKKQAAGNPKTAAE